MERKLISIVVPCYNEELTVEKFYSEGLLNIEAPEDIMDSFTRKMAAVNEDVTVSEFEENENALIHMVYDGRNMVFPRDELNLNGMMITYDKRE